MLERGRHDNVQIGDDCAQTSRRMRDELESQDNDYVWATGSYARAALLNWAA